jgi:serine/threonine-protein kinase RsbW
VSACDTPPPADVRLAFVGSVAGIVAICEWVETTCRSAGVHSDTTYAVQVCAEELLGNILRHGGRPSPRIEVTLSFSPGRVTLTVEDDGPAFDVSAAVPHRVDRTLDAVEPGGLGIQLIRSFASGLDYQRAGLGNRVVLTFDDPREA